MIYRTAHLKEATLAERQALKTHALKKIPQHLTIEKFLQIIQSTLNLNWIWLYHQKIKREGKGRNTAQDFKKLRQRTGLFQIIYCAVLNAII